MTEMNTTQLSSSSLRSSLGELVVGVDGTDESFTALKWAMNESSTTGQKVHAVYGWTHSWDLGDEPSTPQEWEHARTLINAGLVSWAEKASEGIDFDKTRLKLTSVHAAGSTALLDIGKHAHQIVVGHRTLNTVARWFFGSISEDLVDQSEVPVTIVHSTDQTSMKTSAASEEILLGEITEEILFGRGRLLPIIVGVDGSQASIRALNFAAQAAYIEHRDLHAFYCWQTKSLAQYMEKEHAIPSLTEEQEIAQKILNRVVDQADIPANLSVTMHAIHTSPAKGLLEASRFAHRIITGSRGLGKFDQHVLGSVSKQLIEKSTATVTVIH